jgi:hypothetical protein
MNSTAAGFPRTPDDVNTFGWDTAQFDVTAALWPDDTALTVTFVAGDDGYMAGAVWTAVGLSAR